MTSTKEQSNRGIGAMPGEDRRRSQRVVVRVPVTLVATVGGKAVRSAAYTVEVNTHGALVVSPHALNSGATLEMVNGRTDEKIACRATRASRESEEGFLIPLEFTASNPNFWQISFPATNWKSPEN